MFNFIIDYWKEFIVVVLIVIFAYLDVYMRGE